MRLEGIVCVDKKYGCAKQRQRGDYGFYHDTSLEDFGKWDNHPSFQFNFVTGLKRFRDCSFSPGGKDVFVHISAVERAGLGSLNEGDKVSYEIVQNRGKDSAENLRVGWSVFVLKPLHPFAR
jgi:cold shock CspA family protein